MKLVKTFGAAVQGINATIITIEVNISAGTLFFLVGHFFQLRIRKNKGNYFFAITFVFCSKYF